MRPTLRNYLRPMVLKICDAHAECDVQELRRHLRDGFPKFLARKTKFDCDSYAVRVWRKVIREALELDPKKDNGGPLLVGMPVDIIRAGAFDPDVIKRRTRDKQNSASRRRKQRERSKSDQGSDGGVGEGVPNR